MNNSNGKPDHGDWLTAEFFENRRRLPEADLLKHAGQHVAWSWDGTQIVASADSLQQLHEQVALWD
jgi:hypothetical protein